MEHHQHTYMRDLQTDSRSSLSVIAGYVPDGSTVLDVGTGSGALGRYLKNTKSCTVDGITHNRDEAKLSEPHYRRIEVSDLEDRNWVHAHSESHYDCIVFADVLEHLKHPAKALEDCKPLLKENGIILISIPNIGYAYFIAELMKGEFEYGEEGLLDKTHLRFFTRRSFSRLLEKSGWYISAFQPIHQPWHETEFRIDFGKIPQNVGDYILSQPDAGTYQMVFIARKSTPRISAEITPETARVFSPATFLTQIYLITENGIQANSPVNALGNIGGDHQSIEFCIPAGSDPIIGIRLDVADREGFMRIDSVEGLNSNGERAFWLGPRELQPAVASPGTHQLVDITPSNSANSIWLQLTGSDPHFQLPLQQSHLHRWLGGGRRLRVWCSWPWSPDYHAAKRPLEAAAVPMPQPNGNIERGGWLQRIVKFTNALTAHRPMERVAASEVTEVIVPVFNNLHLTRRCLESVLASSNRSALHVTVINDGSTDPEVHPWLRFFAELHPEIDVVENVTNQGFVKTVNLGMRMAGTRDAVLLNSDTQVTHHWLDRLRAVALLHEKTASVTPFSNNATICSFPSFCVDNPFPTTETLERVNQLAGQMFALRAVPIPTAVGFCVYVKRAAWTAVGEFDHTTFGLGYGEENDWCMRASKAGWVHLHALDVYVAHQGGASFSDRRLALQASAQEKLLALHPDYNEKVRAYVKSDPAKSYREALDQALNAEHASDTPTP